MGKSLTANELSLCNFLTIINKNLLYCITCHVPKFSGIATRWCGRCCSCCTKCKSWWWFPLSSTALSTTLPRIVWGRNALIWWRNISKPQDTSQHRLLYQRYYQEESQHDEVDPLLLTDIDWQWNLTLVAVLCPTPTNPSFQGSARYSKHAPPNLDIIWPVISTPMPMLDLKNLRHFAVKYCSEATIESN